MEVVEAMATEMYGNYHNFDIISDHLSRTSQLCITLHPPWYIVYLVPRLVGS